MLKLTHPSSGSTFSETGNMRAGFIIMLGYYVSLTDWLAWSFFTVREDVGVHHDVNSNGNDHNNARTGEDDNVRNRYIVRSSITLSHFSPTVPPSIYHSFFAAQFPI
jgi:hypothetical protein